MPETRKLPTHMGRSETFCRALISLYESGDLGTARALFEANPSGVRYHMRHLVALGLIPTLWVDLVCGGVLAPYVVVRETEARLSVTMN